MNPYRFFAVFTLVFVMNFATVPGAESHNLLALENQEKWLGNPDIINWDGETLLLGPSEDKTYIGYKDLDFTDFKLEVEIRLPELGNSGIYFRGKYNADKYGINGFQGDVGDEHWGKLWPQQKDTKCLDSVKLDGWNQYVVKADGNNISISINGVKCIDYVMTENEEEGYGWGTDFGLQHHAGDFVIHVRKFEVTPLGEPTNLNLEATEEAIRKKKMTSSFTLSKKVNGSSFFSADRKPVNPGIYFWITQRK